MTYLQIAILAIIQGAAELLPVSSSAHVIVAERLMKLDPSLPELTFLLVMLHTGTMFAVLCYFWPRWRALWLRHTGPSAIWGPGRWHFPKMVVLATVCTGLVALPFLGAERLGGGEIESLFKNLPLIATGLLCVGLFILAAGRLETKAEKDILPVRSSILIGIVQGFCLPFRGFSRSGATISTALYCGISRRLAEDFSFALAVVLTPPVVFREFHRLLKQHPDLSTRDLVHLLQPGLVGMILSFVAGLLALRLLSAVLEAGRWKWFGVYCLFAAAAVWAIHFFGL